MADDDLRECARTACRSNLWAPSCRCVGQLMQNDRRIEPEGAPWYQDLSLWGGGVTGRYSSEGGTPSAWLPLLRRALHTTVDALREELKQDVADKAAKRLGWGWCAWNRRTQVAGRQVVAGCSISSNDSSRVVE